MPRSRPSLRLFVALYPPAAVSSELAAAVLALDLPPGRATAPAQVHVTVHFIGSVAVADLDRVTESVGRAAAGLPAFDLETRGLVTLPARGPARLVAVGTSAPPPLLELKRRLALRFARGARAHPADRFRPHLTMYRFRAPARVAPLEAPLDATAFRVESAHLVRSDLRPDGARHETLETFALDAGT